MRLGVRFQTVRLWPARRMLTAIAPPMMP